MIPFVKCFFDDVTNTATYVVSEPGGRSCAVIDSVLDYEAKAGRTATTSADDVIAYIRENKLTCEWILETHAHADHFSAAPYLKNKVGGKIAIGEHIPEIQRVFGGIFNAGHAFKSDGSQFDELLQLEKEIIEYDLKTIKAIVKSHLAKSNIERFILD